MDDNKTAEYYMGIHVLYGPIFNELSDGQKEFVTENMIKGTGDLAAEANRFRNLIHTAWDLEEELW